MYIAILALLSVLVVLAGVILWKLTSSRDPGSTVESVLNEKFLSFSDNIRQAMDLTRKEVERSKEVLSDNVIKTLENMNRMNRQIDGLRTQQEKAQQLGQSLEYLLQTPKLRGNYGETVLEEMLDRILPKGMWQRQYRIDDGCVVDAVVRYKDVIIPIDSKFPKDHYQRYLQEDDVESKKRHWSDYQKALKTEIVSIRDKYIKPGKGTSEFALLFIPSESIYYETIAETNYIGDPSQIYEYASENKVLPVSPNTFYAFLNVVMLGIRNIEIARDARKLQESLSRIEKDFHYFYKKFELLGRSLGKASEAYRIGDDHLKRFKGRLDSTLRLDIELEEKTSREAVEGNVPPSDESNE